MEVHAVLDSIKLHGVTHYCGAPIVHSMIVNAGPELQAGIKPGVRAMVAGAAPPAALIQGMEQLGFDIIHVYGLTEVCRKWGHPFIQLK